MADKLPIELVNEILTYDNRFVLRNGKIIEIKRIPKTDPRYKMLLQIPRLNFHSIHGISYIYLPITKNKDYFISYSKKIIKIITLMHKHSIGVYVLETNMV